MGQLFDSFRSCGRAVLGRLGRLSTLSRHHLLSVIGNLQTSALAFDCVVVVVHNATRREREGVLAGPQRFSSSSSSSLLLM